MPQANLAELYEAELVQPLFRPWAAILLDHVDLVPGIRLVDLACGTGIVARVAAERLQHTASIVGIDASPRMLQVARVLAPGIDWREGKAESLPVPDHEKFDIVTCQQGLQFFADLPAAMGQMRRVLTPGGWLALATWRPIDEIPFLRDLQEVAERYVGTIVDQRHKLGDEAELRSLLARAEFRDVCIETVSSRTSFAPALPFLRLNTMAIVGMSEAAATLDQQQRAEVVVAIVDKSQEVLRRYSETDGIEFDMSANIATARN